MVFIRTGRYIANVLYSHVFRGKYRNRYMKPFFLFRKTFSGISHQNIYVPPVTEKFRALVISCLTQPMSKPMPGKTYVKEKNISMILSVLRAHRRLITEFKIPSYCYFWRHSSRSWYFHCKQSRISRYIHNHKILKRKLIHEKGKKMLRIKSSISIAAIFDTKIDLHKTPSLLKRAYILEKYCSYE